MIRHLALLLPCVLLSACIVVEDSNSPGIARRGGPPPWAPAHGHRAKQARTYYYYPSVGIYYDVSTRMYFFADGGSWKTSLSLPAGVVIDGDSAVRLELDTDKPYLYIEDHQRQHKPHKQKKGKKRIKASSH